jgi:hypothetical protein
MAEDLYVIGLDGITTAEASERVRLHVSSHVRGGHPCDCDRPISLVTKSTASLANNCLMVPV